MKDFRKYSLGMVSGGVFDDYFKKLPKNNTSLFLSDSNGSLIDIFTKMLDDRIIFLTDYMSFDVCNLVKAQILYLETKSNEDIKIYIDCVGGSIYSGLGVLDIMDYVKSDVVTINTGLAASMGALVLCSGEKGKRKSLKRCRTMIHQPVGYGGDYRQASDMEIETKEIVSLKKELYRIISDRSGQSYDKVSEDGDRDYWMTSEDAKSYGLIDDIIINKNKYDRIK